MRIKLTIELELEEGYGTEEDAKLCLENEILVGDGTLLLHSNEVGDTVGTVKSVKNIQYLD